MATQERIDPQRGERIGYIRETIPDFEVPAYEGERYEAMVPDTLDIEERARLAIHGLTSITDPDMDYEIYWIARFWRDPPILAHEWSDLIQPKFMEDLPLLRLVTGSELNNHVDRAWMESFLRMIGPDGLAYMPSQGRPWGRPPAGYSWGHGNVVYRANGEIASVSDTSVTQFGHPAMWNGRIIGALTLYYLHDGNPMWRAIAERMIQRLAQLMIDKGDYAYFPHGFFEPNAQIPQDAKMARGSAAMESAAPIWLIQGLVQYYNATGYELALEQAGKLVRALLRDEALAFDKEGRFIADPDHPVTQWYSKFLDAYFDADGGFRWGAEPYDGPGYTLFYLDNAGAIERHLVGAHFHRHTYARLAILEYAIATGDRDLMALVQKGYRYGHTRGSAMVGFFPEYTAVPNFPTSETCEVADMIALALKLTEAGVGDYWDDVDRWVRNQFAESQLTYAEWIENIRRPKVEVALHESGNRAVERNIGTFAGWPSANDWVVEMSYDGPPDLATMHCCTGNAARTLYYVWQRILDWDAGQLRVNLLLNRASPWADVDSHIPYEGRVDLKIKQPCRSVQIRVPEWIGEGSDQVGCQVNGIARELSWNGRYVNVGAVRADDTITVSFPTWERTVRAVIGGVLYTLIVKGNDVVSIDPPGKNCPLYQRARYRDNQARWHRVERFVSSEVINW